jgi:hypothetical protein
LYILMESSFDWSFGVSLWVLARVDEGVKIKEKQNNSENAVKI